MTDSYAQKLLRATLILPAGNFPGKGNTLTLVGYRMRAEAQGAAGFPYQLDLTVFGMRQADMNAVTILWASVAGQPTAMNARALVKLEASSDGGTSWCQVFEGTFTQAQPDYRNPPQVGLHALAVTGNGAQIQIAPPTSYRGSTSVLSILQSLADNMNFTLEPNGISGNLSTPYYGGSYMDQFRQVCEHANLDFYFDGDATLAVCPNGQPRVNKAVQVLSPTSGLKGFPTIQQFGLHIDALFRPAFTTGLGSPVKVEGSGVPGANGMWKPFSMLHTLESLQPDGAWFSGMDCTPVQQQ